jgi:hypothetical protein
LLVSKPSYASFSVAKSICAARGMRLPEIYYKQEMDQLVTFLKKHNISRCFAGLRPDPIDSIQRFISTGLPIWFSPHEYVERLSGTTIDINSLLDDINVKFLYSINGTLTVTFDSPHVAYEKPNSFGSPYYRDRNNVLSEVESRVVCQTAWDGIFPKDIKAKAIPYPGFQVLSRQVRDLNDGIFQRHSFKTN